GMALLPAPVAAVARRHGAQVRPLAFSLPLTCNLFHRRGPLTPAALAFVALAQDAVPPGAGRPAPAAADAGRPANPETRGTAC
ncbi:hypothetical protein AB0M19_38660, partial [Streptomyces sp. NPDC051920]